MATKSLWTIADKTLAKEVSSHFDNRKTWEYVKNYYNGKISWEQLWSEYLYWDVWNSANFGRKWDPIAGKDLVPKIETWSEISARLPSYAIWLEPGNGLPFGNVTIKLKTNATFWDGLSSVINAVGGFHKDITSASAYLLTAPVNTIINDKIFTPEFETGAGELVGGGAIMGIDSVHILGKEFARTITGGLVDDVLDVVRTEDRKVKNVGDQFKYDFDDSPLEDIAKYSEGGAALIGQLYGNKVASDNKLVKALQEGGAVAHDVINNQGPATAEDGWHDVTPPMPEDAQNILLLLVGAFIVLIIILA